MAIYFFDPVQDITNLGLYKPFLSACRSPCSWCLFTSLHFARIGNFGRKARFGLISYDWHTGGRTNRFFALIRVACSRLSVSGGLKKRAGDEWGLVRKKQRSDLLFSPGSRSPLIPRFARSLFRSSSLTESLEQAIIRESVSNYRRSKVEGNSKTI